MKTENKKKELLRLLKDSGYVPALTPDEIVGRFIRAEERGGKNAKDAMTSWLINMKRGRILA